ncbi:MAG: dihydroorotate dehydrogenase [Candidatus Aminicenantes bacterium]|nr:dihydroorotate dehydrogenase [Candidatus Aminicenantes bacterium]
MVDLSVDLGFIGLKNPVIPASGTFGYGEEFLPFFNLDLLGAFVFKGIYKNKRMGNPPPRIQETPAGLLNSIGLPGPGMKELKKIIKRVYQSTSTPIIINVCGETDQEYLDVAEYFDRMEEVAILELNISCPNVKSGGRCPAQDDKHTYRLVKQIKQSVSTPLIVKLSPNVTDISAIAISAEEAGADCISLTNTFLGMAIDLESRKPLALRLVWEVARCVHVPVIGMGGITTGQDVLEFILAGATAVQTGTINLIEPSASIRIIKEIEQIMKEQNLMNLRELRGTLKT